MANKATTRFAALMITHQCNLHCTYCYEVYKKAQTMSVEMAKRYIRRVFDQVVSSPVKYEAIEFSFMGGEPLLEFNIIQELCEWTWQQEWPVDYYFFASTNGTLLDDSTKQWLKKHRQQFILGLSLDGTMQMQLVNRGELATRIDIDFFRSVWPQQSIKATVSPHTLPFLAQGIIHLHEIGFSSINANLAYGIEWTNDHLSIYKEQLIKLVNYYVEHPDKERCSLLSMDITSIIDLTHNYAKFCGCGVGTTLYDIDGHEYPCAVFSPITMPESLLKRLPEIDFTDDAAFLMDACKPCILHRACPRCYGTNFLHRNNPASQDPFLCNAFKLQVLANCLLTEYRLSNGMVDGEDGLSIQNALNILQTVL